MFPNTEQPGQIYYRKSENNYSFLLQPEKMMTSHHIQYSSQHTLMKAMHTRTCTPKNPYPNERNEQTSVHTHAHTQTHTQIHIHICTDILIPMMLPQTKAILLNQVKNFP